MAIFVLVEVVQPVEGLHIEVPERGFELRLRPSPNEHAFRHVLSDAPEVQGVGVVTDDLATSLAASYFSFAGLVMPGKDDRRP